MISNRELKEFGSVLDEMYPVKPLTHDAPMEVMAVPYMDDCPANEARNPEILQDSEPAPVYETEELRPVFYIGVLPDGSQIRA